MTKPGSEEADALIVSTTVLSCIFGVSIMSITNWHRDGMPRAGKNRWRIADCVKWRIGRIEAAATGDADINEERRRLIVEQRRGQEIDNAERLGELLPADEVHTHLQALASTAAGLLESMPQRLAPRLVSLSDPKVILGVLVDECRHVRRAAGQAWAAYGVGLGGGDDLDAATVKRRRAVGRRASRVADGEPGAGTVED